MTKPSPNTLVLLIGLVGIALWAAPLGWLIWTCVVQ